MPDSCGQGARLSVVRLYDITGRCLILLLALEFLLDTAIFVESS